MKRIASRAKVKDVYPHRLLHPFTITHLRDDGDVFTQRMLFGHSDLTRVKRFARIANIDRESAHRKASPVDNWRL